MILKRYAAAFFSGSRKVQQKVECNRKSENDFNGAGWAKHSEASSLKYYFSAFFGVSAVSPLRAFVREQGHGLYLGSILHPEHCVPAHSTRPEKQTRRQPEKHKNLTSWIYNKSFFPFLNC